MIGSIDSGNDTVIVFAWIFHQSHLAKEQFEMLSKDSQKASEAEAQLILIQGSL